MKKLAARNRTHAVARALELGLLERTPPAISARTPV